MAKKSLNGKYVTLEDVRVSYDEKTGNIHLTSKDKDLTQLYNFNLTVNNGKESELALRELLFNNDMLAYREPFVFPDKYDGIPEAQNSEWNTIPLGINRAGQDVFWNPTTQPNMLLSGATGRGKTAVLHGVINHCLNHPENWQISLIDPHQGMEFFPYIDRHLDVEIASERDRAYRMISDMKDEMTKRYEMMKDQGVTKFSDLSENLPARLLVINEASWLLSLTSSQSEAGYGLSDENTNRIIHLLRLGRILSYGRAAGISIIVSSQRITDNILDKDMRGQFEMRIHMGRGSGESSFMTLGNNKATTLANVIGRGYVQSGHKGEEVQFFRPSLQNNL